MLVRTDGATWQTIHRGQHSRSLSVTHGTHGSPHKPRTHAQRDTRTHPVKSVRISVRSSRSKSQLQRPSVHPSDTSTHSPAEAPHHRDPSRPLTASRHGHAAREGEEEAST